MILKIIIDLLKLTFFCTFKSFEKVIGKIYIDC